MSAVAFSWKDSPNDDEDVVTLTLVTTVPVEFELGAAGFRDWPHADMRSAAASPTVRRVISTETAMEVPYTSSASAEPLSAVFSY
jgi:hypothetical protein